MRDRFLVFAALSGFFAVGLGAFGSHALKGVLPPEMISVYETANRYHFYHTFALFLSGILLHRNNSKWLLVSMFCFSSGILFFCGSLYLLAVTNIRIFGAVTPVGGILFLSGWFCMALGVYKSSE
ncbi:MAG: DUF423 domain-containing protein [Leptospira sp.]|nr:DUF423 domain-containing protein [Leptospira sp.]